MWLKVAGLSRPKVCPGLAIDLQLHVENDYICETHSYFKTLDAHCTVAATVAEQWDVSDDLAARGNTVRANAYDFDRSNPGS